MNFKSLNKILYLVGTLVLEGAVKFFKVSLHPFLSHSKSIYHRNRSFVYIFHSMNTSMNKNTMKVIGFTVLILYIQLKNQADCASKQMCNLIPLFVY